MKSLIFFCEEVSENRTGDGKGQSPLLAMEGWGTGKFPRSREAGDVSVLSTPARKKMSDKITHLFFNVQLRYHSYMLLGNIRSDQYFWLLNIFREMFWGIFEFGKSSK